LSARIVVVVNPRAGQARRRPARRDRLRAALGDLGEIAAPEGLDALRATCAGLAADRVRFVAIAGGDGTVGRTVTEIVSAYGEGETPVIALLGGGTMNTLARAFGGRGRPDRLLRAFVAHATGERPLPVRPHPTLRVDGDRVGMLFGDGLFARYIIAYDAAGGGPAAAARVLARAVVSALVGGPFAARLTERRAARIEVDGEIVADGRWLVAAAGTIPQVGLGFAPFARVREAPGRFAFLVIGCSPFALALRLWRAYVGYGLAHPRVIEGVATRVRLLGSGQAPYMMDGDVGGTGPVTTVEVGPAIDVVRLRG
jgi:diacylglycerol kinase (ATP)